EPLKSFGSKDLRGCRQPIDSRFLGFSESEWHDCADAFDADPKGDVEVDERRVEKFAGGSKKRVTLRRRDSAVAADLSDPGLLLFVKQDQAVVDPKDITSLELLFVVQNIDVFG